MRGRFVRDADEHRGCTLWIHIGGRLQARRIHLGLSIDNVAQELGIKPGAYDAYEAGVQLAPVLLLSRIAELFSVPVLWFFQDIRFHEDHGEMAATKSGDVYRVATPDERAHYLADAFCKLDLEGQQQLLAIAIALCRTNPKRVRG
jgi:transcriptional regulator with XRE-family HTH domain